MNTQKLLHGLDMKLNHITTYTNKPFTLADLIRHTLYKKIELPLKTTYHMGTCDACGKWHKNLEPQIVGYDVDFDEDGMIGTQETGLVCQECYDRIEDEGGYII